MKEELIKKFERNKDLVGKFKKLFKEYTDQTNKWKTPAFFDSSLTNEQYYNELDRISRIEYSDLQYETLKTYRFNGEELPELILSLDNQHNALELLYNEMLVKYN